MWSLQSSSMRSGWCAILCIATVCILTIPGSVSAKQVGGNVWIDEGSYYGWRMDIVIPTSVEFEFTCLNGTPVNVLVLDEANYTLFTSNQTYSYVEKYSHLEVVNVTGNMTVISGTVYIVVDNQNNLSGMNGLEAPGRIQVQYWIGSSFDLHAIPDNGSSWMMYLGVVLLAIVFVFVLFMTRKVVRSRKKSKE